MDFTYGIHSKKNIGNERMGKVIMISNVNYRRITGKIFYSSAERHWARKRYPSYKYPWNEKSFAYFIHTAQKMKFCTKDFFSKCDQIRRKLRIWSHLLKKSLIENFIFCAVTCTLQAMQNVPVHLKVDNIATMNWINKKIKPYDIIPSLS